MKKHNRILLIVLLAIFLGGLTWVVLQPREPEPVYQGKPLSFWLTGYDPGNYNLKPTRGPSPPTSKQADEAIRQIGSNAIPTLLRLLQKQDSPFKVKIVGLLQRQHLITLPLAPLNQSTTAFQSFISMGPNASNAVPRLIEIFDHDPSPFPQQAVPAILGYIGPAARQAVPTLLRGMTHTNGMVRNNAIFALGRIHAEPELVVPALINCLNDPDALICAHAARALGVFGKDAQSAVPALLELWRREPVSPAVTSGSHNDFDTSVGSSWGTSTLFGYGMPDVRGTTKDALQSIDPEAAAKAGVK